jgi:hypothetical protein
MFEKKKKIKAQKSPQAHKAHMANKLTLSFPSRITLDQCSKEF